MSNWRSVLLSSCFKRRTVSRWWPSKCIVGTLECLAVKVHWSIATWTSEYISEIFKKWLISASYRMIPQSLWSGRRQNIPRGKMASTCPDHSWASTEPVIHLGTASTLPPSRIGAYSCATVAQAIRMADLDAAIGPAEVFPRWSVAWGASNDVHASVYWYPSEKSERFINRLFWGRLLLYPAISHHTPISYNANPRLMNPPPMNPPQLGGFYLSLPVLVHLGHHEGGLMDN
jgi:hypothetical protein